LSPALCFAMTAADRIRSRVSSLPASMMVRHRPARPYLSAASLTFDQVSASARPFQMTLESTCASLARDLIRSSSFDCSKLKNRTGTFSTAATWSAICFARVVFPVEGAPARTKTPSVRPFRTSFR